MNKHGAIGVRELESGEVVIHAGADPGGGYQTLCGQAVDGDIFEEIQIKDHQRISCAQCFYVWLAAKQFTGRNFKYAACS